MFNLPSLLQALPCIFLDKVTLSCTDLVLKDGDLDLCFTAEPMTHQLRSLYDNTEHYLLLNMSLNTLGKLFA